MSDKDHEEKPERVQVHTYDGTYHFDVIRKTVAIYKQGLIYFPGDYYYVKIDEIKDE